MLWIKLNGGVRKISLEVSNNQWRVLNFDFGDNTRFKKDCVVNYRIYRDSGTTLVDGFHVRLHKIDIHLSNNFMISYASPLKADIDAIEKLVLGEEYYG